MSVVVTARRGFQELYQTDMEFESRPNMRHYGCFALSILRALAVHFDMVTFTHEHVLGFIDDELIDSTPDITNEMAVEDAQDLIDDFVGPGKVKFLSFLPGNTHFPPDTVVRPEEFGWGCWYRTGTSFNHFTQGTVRPVIFDPWGGGSLSVKSGNLLSIRKAVLL